MVVIWYSRVRTQLKAYNQFIMIVDLVKFELTEHSSFDKSGLME